MELLLPSGQIITLHEQQEAALLMLETWWKDPTQLFARLMGYAGTGKTTLCKAFTDKVRGEIHHSIVVSAPTHKAKANAQMHTGFQFDGETIQGLLGLAPDTDLENFDPNKPEFAQKNEPKIGNFRFAIIDEASMMNAFLCEAIMDAAENSNCKILFVLDPAQLPPVNEVISPVITSDRIEYSYEMTFVHRQKGDNPLMFILDKLRNDLRFAGSPYDGENQHVNENAEGITTFTNNVDFARKLITAFREEEVPGTIKLMAYTNETVRAWNNYIRRGRYGADLQLLMSGEILMSYSNVKGKIMNSGEYVVRHIVETVKDFSVSPKMPSMFDAPSSKVQPPEITIPQVRVYTTTLYDMYNKVELKIDILHPGDAHHVAKGAQRYIAACVKNKALWRKYFDWRAGFYSMEDVKIGNRLVLKLDLTYGYAMTVHKSQGSTYEHVFVDDIDISKQFKPVERNKLRYVALSRPRKTATVLINS